MAAAIEAGVVTETTVRRLGELEAEKRNIEDKLRPLKAIRPVDKDKLIFTLEKLREGDIDSPRFQKLLIRSFVKAVWVFDDRIKIDYNLPTGSSDGDKAPPYESVRTAGSYSIIYCITGEVLSAVFGRTV